MRLQGSKNGHAVLEELRLRLEEAEETLHAIRAGEVDSLLVEGPGGPRVFALEGSNHSYRVLVEAMNDGAATLNEDGLIAYCNGCFARLLEAPLNQVMGGFLGDYVAPESRAAFATLLRRVAHASEGKSELLMQSARGRQIPVHLSISVVEEQRQKTLCLVATDLSQQKQELDRILSSMSDSVLVFDNACRIVRANAAAVQLLGFDPANHQRAEIDERLPLLSSESRSLDDDERPWARALRGEIITGLPVTLLRGDERLELSVSCSPLRTSSDITGAVSVWHDLTPVKQAVARAERTSAELHAIIEAIPHAVYFGNRDGITRCNAEACRMLGASSFADLQTHIDELSTRLQVRYRDDGELVQAEHLPFNCALAGRPATLDTWAIRADSGKRVLVRGNSAPVCLGDDIIGAVAVDIDITDRREAEEALREADRNKNQFMAMLSHELRNPLAPINNSLYILDHTLPGSEQAERARSVVKRQVAHLTRIVEDLLDVTRVSRGKIQLKLEIVEMGGLVRRSVEDFCPSFAAAGVRIELRDSGDPLAVRGDRTRLAQVLGNLLHNASKFTPAGGKAVVEVSHDGASKEAVVSVSDDGVGIGADVLSRLFQPFWQADQTLDRSRGGLGLGLALVRGMVELHNGSVSVSSPGVGLGSTFTLRFPLACESEIGACRPSTS